MDIKESHHQAEQNVVNRSTRGAPSPPAGPTLGRRWQLKGGCEPLVDPGSSEESDRENKRFMHSHLSDEW